MCLGGGSSRTVGWGTKGMGDRNELERAPGISRGKFHPVSRAESAHIQGPEPSRMAQQPYEGSLWALLWGSSHLAVRLLQGAGFCQVCFLILRLMALQKVSKFSIWLTEEGEERSVPWSVPFSAPSCSSERKTRCRRDSTVWGKKGKGWRSLINNQHPPYPVNKLPQDIS